MAKSSLTPGLVTGKSSGPLAGGMTVNPAIDNTNSARVHKALLATHAKLGNKTLPPKSGAAQPAAGSAGQKIGGGASIKGGRF